MREPFFNIERKDRANNPRARIKDVVVEALTNRGFSDAESDQMVKRLIRYGELALDGGHRIVRLLPFGKYKSWDITEVPPNYLYWLTTQNWFLEKFEDLYQEIITHLGV